MRSHGNKITKLVLTILVFIIFATSRAQDSAYYYICGYENDYWGTNVLFSKIDLERKSIVYSISLPLEGEIQFKKPIIFQRENNRFFFISSLNGLPAKNSEILQTRVSNYAILDEIGAVIFTGQIPNVHLMDFEYAMNNDINIMIKMDRFFFKIYSPF